MRALYFTGAYRPDSMVSHTHGDLVAAIRARGVDAEMLTLAPGDQTVAVTARPDSHGTTVTYLRAGSGISNRARRFYSARRWRYAPFLSSVRALRHYLTPAVLARYDVIQVGMAFPHATIFRHALAGRAHPPVIVTITGGDIATGEKAEYGYGRTATTRREIATTLQWAALVQANSPQSARVVAAFGCPPARIAIQPPQSPVAPVPPAAITAYRAAARTRLLASGVLPAGRVLIGLGRMVPVKAYDDVIRALPAIRAACGDVSAHFIGPARDAAATAYAQSLTALAASLDMSDHVTVRGQIPADDVPAYLAAADLVLVPSLYDGLNKTGIEAGAVGTPVVISDAAGLADYVWEYGAGVVVPPRAPDALASAIIALLSDTPAWTAVSVGAHAMAETFTLDHTADGVIRLYERVLGNTLVAATPEGASR